MPVDTQHVNYEANLAKWKKCRDAVEGEEAVKLAGRVYLPQLTGQEPNEYEAYKERALFYAAANRTAVGLSGMVLRKKPAITWPKSDLDYLKTLGVEGESLVTLCRQAIEEVLTTGRVGVMVDAPDEPDALPYITLYYPENIINWREETFAGPDGTVKKQLILVVLSEEGEELDPDDPFVSTVVPQYRVLSLDEGELVVRLWRKREVEDPNSIYGAKREEWYVFDTIRPTFKGGRPIDFIPFLFITPSGITCEIEKSPLLDLVNVNLSHYRNSADLEHGLHFTALPTAWVAGFKMEEAALRIGSSRAWVSEDPSAHAGFLEFSGAGLKSIADRMESKQSLMAVLGARLLEEQPDQAETATAVLLRHQGEASQLASIAGATGDGMTLALKWVALWRAMTDDVSIVLSQDFNTGGLSSQDLTALMGAYQGGLISYDTWFFNLQQAGLFPDDRTKEDEIGLIEQGGPQHPSGAIDLAKGQQDLQKGRQQIEQGEIATQQKALSLQQQQDNPPVPANRQLIGAK